MQTWLHCCVRVCLKSLPTSVNLRRLICVCLFKKITHTLFTCVHWCTMYWFHCSDQPPAVVPVQQETAFVEVHLNDAPSPIPRPTTGTTPLLTPQSQQYPRESLTEENVTLTFSPSLSPSYSVGLPHSLLNTAFCMVMFSSNPHSPAATTCYNQRCRPHLWC